MCSCEPSYVCLDHRGTRHDPAYFDTPDPRELEQERWESLIGQPDFQKPYGVAR